jgi:hypothetical protein
MTYKLKNKNTGEEIGLLNEVQFQFLRNELQELGKNDNDYWLHRDQLITFRENGADNILLGMFESAFGKKVQPDNEVDKDDNCFFDNDELEIILEKI